MSGANELAAGQCDFTRASARRQVRAGKKKCSSSYSAPKKLTGQPCWVYVFSDGRGICKIGVACHIPSRFDAVRNDYRKVMSSPGSVLKIAAGWQFASRDEAYCVEQLALWATFPRVQFSRSWDKPGYRMTNMQDTSVRDLHALIVKKGGPRILIKGVAS